MNVTAENITCRKCRAVGLHNFKRGPVYIEGGLCLDVISCLICSDWYASKPAVMKMERQVEPVKDRGLAICHVNGCSNYISASPGQNKSGLCTSCSNRMTAWRSKGSVGLPPLIKTPTGYMTRVAFQQLNDPKAAEKTNSSQPCATPGCQKHLRKVRSDAGETLCGDCKQIVDRRSLRTALNSQEANHVETTPELPRLAPAASPAPAVRNPARHPAQLRRDDHEGVVGSVPDLQQLLADIGLPTPAETVRSWSLAEWSEVHAWAKATQAKRSSRRVPPMPDILCPIYDALYAERSA